MSTGESLVAHIVVVGFHATLGSNIEFAYPPLRGSVSLRSPKLSDTADLASWSTGELDKLSLGKSTAGTNASSSDTGVSTNTNIQLPTTSDITLSSVHRQGSGFIVGGSPTKAKDGLSSSTRGRSLMVSSPTGRSSSALLLTEPSNMHPPKQEWGILPRAWHYLPILALPDGVHDRRYDTVFFTLPPAVHCVACFRQVETEKIKNHSASRIGDDEVAARGSIQKSVVLLCKRPLYGALAERLVGGVRAYFQQNDFARTDVLAALYHSLNTSFSRPSLNNSNTLFHALDLRSLFVTLGPAVLCILKLLLLEKRIIFHSQPIVNACNGIAALTSILPGCLDSLSPSIVPLDRDSLDCDAAGFPLSLFGEENRCEFQPYAPLPLLIDLISSNTEPRRGCLIGTSQNVATLLAGRMSAEEQAEKVASARVAAKVGSSSAISAMDGHPASNPPISATSQKKPSGRAQLPQIDVMVNLTNGKVVYRNESLRKLSALSTEEMDFVKELVAMARQNEHVEKKMGAARFAGSDDHLRRRMRFYMLNFLRSVARACAASAPMPGDFIKSSGKYPKASSITLGPEFNVYNLSFVEAWLSSTHNAREWTRKCPTIAHLRSAAAGLGHASPVPLPTGFEGPPESEMPDQSSGHPAKGLDISRELLLSEAESNEIARQLEIVGSSIYDSFTSFDTSSAIEDVTTFGQWAFGGISEFLGFGSGREANQSGRSVQLLATSNMPIAGFTAHDSVKRGHNLVVVVPSEDSNYSAAKADAVPLDCDITSMKTPAVPGIKIKEPEFDSFALSTSLGSPRRPVLHP